jgi:prolyl-tRNA synthetase
MRLSRFHLRTEKETPADAEIISHKLMLKAGMVRKLAAGLYTWSPLGLRVLRKIETVVREEMNRAGAIEMAMPSIQPKELWEETGRWAKFGPQLLKIRDRKEQDFCFTPTAEEAVTDFFRQEVASYKQLPLNFYQITSKFRDEIRPRFGVMRAREFIMKDAYSFHIDDASLHAEYQNMYATYTRIFTRLGLKFRAVAADTGAIGGSASHEFHVLADSGEDSLAYCEHSDFAANVELAEAIAPGPRPAATETLREVATPTQKTCEDVAALLGIALQRTAKSVAIMATDADEQPQFVLALVRGDHVVNEIKLAKLPGLAEYRLASESEIREYLGSEPGFLGPLNTRKPIRIIADRSVGPWLILWWVPINRGCISRASIGAVIWPNRKSPIFAMSWMATPHLTARAVCALPVASKLAMSLRLAVNTLKRCVLASWMLPANRCIPPWAVMASGYRVLPPPPLNNITMTMASAGRWRWHRGKLPFASSIQKMMPA